MVLKTEKGTIVTYKEPLKAIFDTVKDTKMMQCTQHMTEVM